MIRHAFVIMALTGRLLRRLGRMFPQRHRSPSVLAGRIGVETA
jgi:hypothetical protein